MKNEKIEKRLERLEEGVGKERRAGGAHNAACSRAGPCSEIATPAAGCAAPCYPRGHIGTVVNRTGSALHLYRSLSLEVCCLLARSAHVA
jgi:hypothetical protein